MAMGSNPRRRKYYRPNSKFRLRRQNAFMYRRTSSGIRGFTKRTYGNPMATTEMKYFTTQRDYDTISNLTNVTNWSNSQLSSIAGECLTAPELGTNYDNRIGRKVIGKRLFLRVTIKTQRGSNPTGARDPFVFRMIVVLDKQTNGIQATGDLILATPYTDGAQQINALQNPDNFGRFKILYDKTHIINNPDMIYNYATSTIDFSGLAKEFTINIDLKDLVINYNPQQTGTDISTIVDNSISVYGGYIGGPNVGAPQCQYVSRFYFKDP